MALQAASCFAELQVNSAISGMGAGNALRAGIVLARVCSSSCRNIVSLRTGFAARNRGAMLSSAHWGMQTASLGFSSLRGGIYYRGFSSSRKWFKWKSKQARASAVSKASENEAVSAEAVKVEQPSQQTPPAKKKPKQPPKEKQAAEAKSSASDNKKPSKASTPKDQQAPTPEKKKGGKAKKSEDAVEDTGVKSTAAKKPAATKNNAKQKPATKEVAKDTTPQKKSTKKQNNNQKKVEVAKVVEEEATANESLLDGKAVVVVESPAKAKTIEKYLGSNYAVVASYGHVRDLAARSGSVRPQDDFDLVWEIPDGAKSHFNQIKSALKGAKAIVLASDPDREGEAIAWHVVEMLKMEGILKKGMLIQRVTFNEITKSAIERGMSAPREISQTLVDAYLARRALDYLIGFDISPLLWRKLPGSKSAGRVQSAALCLIAEREKEIESFTPREFWTVDAEIHAGGDAKCFPSRLVNYNGVKLEQFTLTSPEAEAAVLYISKNTLKVESVKKSVFRRNAPGPYITSTLQQDASNKLGLGASKTMSLAQKLYEGIKVAKDEVVGLITYMRTDSQQLSSQAIDSIRSFAVERYGKEYVPSSPRMFKSKVKNAQEAHEAIRPTDIKRLPSTLADVLDADSMKLYALIWRRTMACQLEQAVFNHVALDVEDPNGIVRLRSTASSVNFPGFRIVFSDKDALVAQDADKEDEEEPDMKLPSLEVGSSISLISVKHVQHFTEPPPRYTEGSLVRKMEELGIGRPSTYAHILKTLQFRQYMQLEKQRIVPQIRGRMVAAFLSRYFPEFVDYGFTAKMEEQLDSISSGSVEWKDVLRQFWPNFHAKVTSTGQVSNKQVAQMLAELFSEKLAGKDRTCPDCHLGELELKLSKFGTGYFLGCNRYPSCHYCNSLDNEDEEEEMGSTAAKTRSRVLGVDPKTGLPVWYKEGPYGDYIQIGEDGKGKLKPKRVRIPGSLKPEEVDLKMALHLVTYPKELGQDSEGKAVVVGIGRFGCYIRREGYSVYVPKDQKVEELTMEKALEILEEGKEARRKIRKAPIQLKQRLALA